jgi:hypothetical protein
VEPEAVSRATAELRELGVPYVDHRFALNPTILPRRFAHEAAAAAQAVFAGMDHLLDGPFGGDVRRMGEFLGFRPREVDLFVRLPLEDWAAVARPDVVLRNGHPAFVEMNATCLSGLLAVADMLTAAQRRLRGNRAVLDERQASAAFGTARLAALLTRRLRAAGLRNGIVGVGVWGSVASGGYDYNQTCLVHELRRHGIPARLCPIEELDLSGETAVLDGEPVAALYRSFWQPEPSRSDRWETVTSLLDLAEQGRLVLLTGFRSELIVSKTCLALLSDERIQDGMSARLRATINAAVPWTRLLEERRTRINGSNHDLIPWMLSHQERLVLKPALGHSGNDVTIGCEVDQRGWHEAVAAALQAEQQWIVQELVAPDLIPLHTLPRPGDPPVRMTPAIYGVFLLDRRFATAIRRYSGPDRAGLKISAATGAVVAPVFWSNRPLPEVCLP